jgi:hypothetical protein
MQVATAHNITLYVQSIISLSQLIEKGAHCSDKDTKMNGALIGLIVVAAIGIILWSIVFVGVKLLENIVSRRTVGQHVEGISLASQSAEELLVNFVRDSPGLTDALDALTTSKQPKQFAQLLHESRIDRATPYRASIEAKATAAALVMLFVSGLVQVATDGLVLTELGREVKRRINAVRRKEHDPNTRLPIAARRKGIAPCVALHLACARSA